MADILSYQREKYYKILISDFVRSGRLRAPSLQENLHARIKKCGKTQFMRTRKYSPQYAPSSSTGIGFTVSAWAELIVIHQYYVSEAKSTGITDDFVP